MKRSRLALSTALLTLAVGAVLVCAGCPAPPEQVLDDEDGWRGTIRISGAWALYPMVVKWADLFRQEHPGVTIDVSAGGAGKGIADAIGGMVDIGMVSRPIHPEEEAQGAWWVPVVMDAVIPTINAQNPVLEELEAQGVSKDRLLDIWITGNVKTWGELAGTSASDRINVYTRSNACGAAATWASFMGHAQEDLLGTAVYGDPGLAQAVRTDPLGVGFNNLNYVFDANTGKPIPELRVLPLDLSGDGTLGPDEDFYGTLEEMLEAIADGRYPSPPSRTEYLVCNGRPTGLTAEFIRWILTEGQQYAPEAGYVPLTDEQIEEALARLQ